MRTGLPAGEQRDFIQPFSIEGHGVRGRLVRLSDVADRIIQQHAYPDSVARLLAEMMALTAVLAAALKYDGVFTLQTKGEGPVKLMVVDLTSHGAMRGYAQFDHEQVAAIPLEQASLPRLHGKGYLAFTVDQGQHTDRYQGIVEMEGATLSDCVHHYFRQSEQLQAGFKIAATKGEEGWRAGAIMLQRLPQESVTEMGAEIADDAWRRAFVLMASCTDRELLDIEVPATDVLYRLFHEDGVRAFKAQGVEAKCRCSRGRVETVLKAMRPDDLADLQVDGRLEVTCEFCNSRYDFPLADFLPARN
ncbi:Hsp33 family molecular chaperone HslO [Dongia deserti]|uniref:Hsp33 family molecular chaperone HslO n=1 Tax=Dongia deserti TaxID=2268030 RepID=UPI000E647C29|nr:Hsp33 family molecular chaperone HslO [Dongia deserti]